MINYVSDVVMSHVHVLDVRRVYNAGHKRGRRVYVFIVSVSSKEVIV